MSGQIGLPLGQPRRRYVTVAGVFFFNMFGSELVLAFKKTGLTLGTQTVLRLFWPLVTPEVGQNHATTCAAINFRVCAWQRTSATCAFLDPRVSINLQ
jgi:hypothetical protein